jgi:hypothetical protein
MIFMALIKLKSLLNETSETDLNRTTSIDFNVGLEGIKKSAMHAVRKYKQGFTILRGLDKETSKITLVRPSLFNRKSRNTYNIYTSLMDTLPSWENYPKRSKSIICTNSLSSASSYGHIYIVLPTDGAKVGVCSGRDLWFSFPYIQKRLKESTMNSFNDLFAILFVAARIDPYDIEPSTIGRYLRDIDLHISNTQGGLYEFISPVLKRFSNIKVESMMEDMENYYDGDMVEYFNELMDPAKNNFYLTTIENYSFDTDKRGNEIWLSADSFMVKSDDPNNVDITSVMKQLV